MALMCERHAIKLSLLLRPRAGTGSVQGARMCHVLGFMLLIPSLSLSLSLSLSVCLSVCPSLSLSSSVTHVLWECVGCIERR